MDKKRIDEVLADIMRNPRIKVGNRFSNDAYMLDNTEHGENNGGRIAFYPEEEVMVIDMHSLTSATYITYKYDEIVYLHTVNDEDSIDIHIGVSGGQITINVNIFH